MASDTLKKRVESALREVKSSRDGADVVTAGLVRAVAVSPPGEVQLDMIIPAAERTEIAAEVKTAAEAVDGVANVRLNVRAAVAEASGGDGPPDDSASGGGRRRSLPIAGAPAETARPTQPDRGAASRHPSEAEPLEGVTHVIAVSSGKGGVGKSTVSTNLAAALARAGHRVGLLDADIYGPDIPTMFGVQEKPRMTEHQVVPLEAHGVKLMSLGFLVDEDTPAIWRGPIIMGIIRQFLQQVAWGELDYLFVDLPPGTGDAQLSLVQLTRVRGAVMVTTPQDVAVGGVLKGIRMFQTLEVPILGVVENMRGFACPDCGSVHEIFGSGGGEKLAASLSLPFLGAIPLGASVREEADRGVPTVVGRPDSPEGEALKAVAERTMGEVARLATPTG